MSDSTLKQTGSIPPEISTELRRLMHDLSNSLEIVLQATYLLSTADNDQPIKEWIGLLDGGMQQTLAVHRKMREFIRENS